jgi:hypothetical protein
MALHRGGTLKQSRSVRKGVPLALFLLVACSNRDFLVTPNEPEGLIPSQLALASSDPVVAAPSVVSAGQAFEVSITTFGDGCVSPGHTDLRITGNRADLFPMDRKSGTTCFAVLLAFEHKVQLSFSRRGNATIFVHGIESGFQRGAWRSWRVTVARKVLVR